MYGVKRRSDKIQLKYCHRNNEPWKFEFNNIELNVFGFCRKKTRNMKRNEFLNISYECVKYDICMIVG